MRKCLLVIAGLWCMLLLPHTIFAQNKMISGIVTDTKGTPLAGASVIVSKTTLGTATDADGKFRLSVPESGSIVISSTGYKSQTFKVSDISGDLTVKLEEDIAKLDEVIVTGLATTV